MEMVELVKLQQNCGIAIISTDANFSEKEGSDKSLQGSI